MRASAAWLAAREAIAVPPRSSLFTRGPARWGATRDPDTSHHALHLKEHLGERLPRRIPPGLKHEADAILAHAVLKPPICFPKSPLGEIALDRPTKTPAGKEADAGGTRCPGEAAEQHEAPRSEYMPAIQGLAKQRRGRETLSPPQGLPHRRVPMAGGGMRAWVVRR